MKHTNSIARSARMLLVILVIIATFVELIPVSSVRASEGYNLDAYIAATGHHPEELAQKLLNAAADYGVTCPQFLEDFNPSGEATAYDFLDWCRNVTDLSINGGFPNAKNHTAKKVMKWYRKKYSKAALKNPMDAPKLIADYQLVKTSRSRISYHWATTTATILLYGEGKYADELWQEGLSNLALEVREQWGYFRKTERMTKIEALQIVMDMLCPTINPMDYPIDMIGTPED